MTQEQHIKAAFLKTMTMEKLLMQLRRDHEGIAGVAVLVDHLDQVAMVLNAINTHFEENVDLDIVDYKRTDSLSERLAAQFKDTW